MIWEVLKEWPALFIVDLFLSILSDGVKYITEEPHTSHLQHSSFFLCSCLPPVEKYGTLYLFLFSFCFFYSILCFYYKKEYQYRILSGKTLNNEYSFDNLFLTLQTPWYQIYIHVCRELTGSHLAQPEDVLNWTGHRRTGLSLFDGLKPSVEA